MKLHTFLLCAASAALFTTSCNDWLDVEPSTEVDRNALFQNEAGFADAMAGVYVTMSTDELYGKNTSWYLIDLIGGSAYTMYGNAATLMNFPFIPSHYDDATTYRNNYIDPIWTKAYNAIVNLNSILEVIDEKQGVFQGNDYAIFKGEALGLRAFLHFDLLRMFSDAPSSPYYSADKTYIPYVETMTSDVYPLLTVDQCCKHILEDLEEARSLLEADPMYTGGTPSEYVCDAVTGNASRRSQYNIQDWHNRRFHFNYYAAVATMARVYHWMGNDTEALHCALDVINAPDGTFTWVAPELVSNIASTSENVARDRTFSTEQIFALHITDLPDRLDGYMIERENAFNGANSDIVAFNPDNFDATTQQYDYRFVYLKATYDYYGNLLYLSNKYYEDNDPNNYSPWSADRLPLIRLSEMYYIAAECEPDFDTAKGYLETVRQHRGLSSYPLTCTNKQQLQDDIEQEYRKEFIAEGQLFYYHKRRNDTYNTRSLYNSYEATPDLFTFPRPDDEDTYGGRN